ncbi:F0F1 ATP synthase subunit delta [Pseudogracilibacillus auburnensis]|uniref:F0F1 ATP synthase subunit delta n=1 Tax=Pseudogracilibacillus auburnensis TaxID=1494959 RepID=UPI001A968419|nr:F0F1 ATP synthase subunit delta [Pseudogracilibacillus auburnensis]MBO1004789.1 F0F1 ATP synthase subunit delta [Pseudogracilibacillus auburnensis]
MSQNIIAERYALALFELAKEQGSVDKLVEELRVVKQVINENPDFIVLLTSPNLSIVEKKQVLNDVFAKASPLVSQILNLLVDAHRQNEIANIADSFIQHANAEKGIADAKVHTVRPLNEAETAAISATFAAKVGRQSLNIENIVDTNLLGGLKVRIGNRIFDGSLRGKLDRLERTLTT